MAKFWLIQRGKFYKATETLFGRNGTVSLDYMGSAEFEWGAIPNGYRRMMYHFSEYEVFHTGIRTPENEELLVLCKKDCAEEILAGIREFIEKPYHLKEFSELDKVPKAKHGDTSFEGRHSNFWWCIDIDSNGDWMAFLSSKRKFIMRAIRSDHQNWWMAKTPEERETEYKKSLRW